MNKTPSEAVELVNMLKPLCANEDVDVVFCVPAIDIIPAVEAAKGSNIKVGAQNCHFEKSGAFTGEVSAVEASIEKAKNLVASKGMYLDSSVIAHPDQRMIDSIL